MALAESLHSCEVTGASKCKSVYTSWRTYCVTNSACNPSGKNTDPTRAERKCTQLAKRIAICEASVDGQSKPSSTADCAEQRRAWMHLCTGVAVHDDTADTTRRTIAITDRYRAAAKEEKVPEARGGAIVRFLADQLECFDQNGAPMAAACTIAHHPIVAILGMAGSLSALGLLQNKPSTAALAGAQRLMGARVHVQASVVSSVVVVMGLAEVVEALEERRRFRSNVTDPSTEDGI